MWTECGHICGVVFRTACNAIRMAERPAWCQMEARRTRLRMRRQRPRAAGRSARARTRWRSPHMESHAAGPKNGGRHATRSGQAVCHTQWAPPYIYIYIYIYMSIWPGTYQHPPRRATSGVQGVAHSGGATHTTCPRRYTQLRPPCREQSTATSAHVHTQRNAYAQRAAGHSRAQSTTHVATLRYATRTRVQRIAEST